MDDNSSGEAAIGLHDVIRDHLAGQADPSRITRMHQALLTAASADLPYVASLAASGGGSGPRIAWIGEPAKRRQSPFATSTTGREND